MQTCAIHWGVYVLYHSVKNKGSLKNSGYQCWSLWSASGEWSFSWGSTKEMHCWHRAATHARLTSGTDLVGALYFSVLLWMGSSSAMLAPFSLLGLPPLQGLFLHQKVPAKLAAESSGEGNERKGDTFLQDLLLRFLLKMKVKGAGRSFKLIVFPSFAHELA